ncbi:PAS-domain containing protein, partial [Escherichia coli]|uniref:PAS-domain containing protein n=1 Tax=Escherichia coli TaxID=562 RepID=UPI001F2739E3
LLCVFDITKHQNLEQRLDQTMLGYRQSLDLISIAVSIFDKNQKLIFYNEAFVQLFDLDEDFIKNLPSHSALLEKLRAAGKLPIIPDWQSWRADLFNIYSNLE